MGQAFCVCSRSVIVVQEKRYLLIDKLGEGGFSYVDLVEGLHDGHFYALKRIICHDKESKHVALSEAHAHQLFQHPNVLPLVGMREMDKAATCEVWLLLPYHQKGTLWDELERLRDKGSVMEEEHISQILHGICSGLKAIHDRGYAHRDMKPTNVLLTNDDKPVIMDLGSMGKAKIEVNGSREAMAIQDWAAERCTISYRAPELFSVENHCIIDEKADIWSLGCVLYAMMFLEGPFDAIFQKGDSVALAVQNSIAIPNSCRYSRYLQDLLTSMMVVNGAERPAVAQILSTLDRWPMSTNNPMV